MSARGESRGEAARGGGPGETGRGGGPGETVRGAPGAAARGGPGAAARGREPAEILAAFGRDLRHARLPRRRWRRALALSVAVVAAGGATAVAANELFAPTPRISAPARPAGAPVPDGASRPVYVAAGAGWRLSASWCRFGARETVALFITVPEAGAGRRCDALAPAVAAGPVTPPTLFAPPRGEALLFGAVPASTTRVQAMLLDSRSGRAEVRELRVRAVRAPKPLTVFVTRLPRDSRLLTAVGLDARGHPTVRCDPEECR